MPAARRTRSRRRPARAHADGGGLLSGLFRRNNAAAPAVAPTAAAKPSWMQRLGLARALPPAAPATPMVLQKIVPVAPPPAVEPVPPAASAEPVPTPQRRKTLLSPLAKSAPAATWRPAPDASHLELGPPVLKTLPPGLTVVAPKRKQDGPVAELLRNAPPVPREKNAARRQAWAKQAPTLSPPLQTLFHEFRTKPRQTFLAKKNPTPEISPASPTSPRPSPKRRPTAEPKPFANPPGTWNEMVAQASAPSPVVAQPVWKPRPVSAPRSPSDASPVSIGPATTSAPPPQERKDAWLGGASRRPRRR